ncbi:sugar phosphate isomerase/epimerase family protein [Candidatus Pelagisphaera phototrophica]|uniref:sugar phosphate isomerase/epimerase family protein n=1 Tax=Candidatus Pelagisphaera phototrophica TaxID=2684113 RepID=UPI0019E6AD47|nr:sugar phosphate isomerase/epimerase family protein [Candidatus Pelagisphaera phototrophica]QXD32101.1 sugar phosphate isomerase/epimerase [Candidatus Pelagisphaera phototrophica]
MKKSISIWSFYGDWSLKDKMKLAKDAGFEGIELDVSGDGPITLDSDEDAIAAIGSLAADSGLTLSGLATGMYWEFNPASENAESRAQAKVVLEKQIRVASQLGIGAVLVVPGSVGADFIPGCEELSYDKVWDRATEFISNALPLAKELGVDIGIENVWNKFLLSPLEMARFIDQFDDAHVGSYFDVGNVLATGYPEHWIRILKDRIRRVHVKDYRRAVGSVDGFVDLLSGDVNWPEVVQSLKSIGYSGWVAAEMIPPVPFYKYAPETLIDNTSRAMDSIFGLAWPSD